MRLEGTLDAFSLPEIFQLLSFTRKTGTLHLRRDRAHGAVHLRDGQVTGGRSDMARQALGRRLVGAGLVDDETLANAVEQLVDTPAAGLGRVLVDQAGLDADTVRRLAAEQATDAVFDLLRWPEGEFAFVVGEPDPDDLGASLPVEQVVEEGRRRLETWAELTAAVPAPDAVVCLTPVPGEAPSLTLDEWQLLSYVDGRRTVADLVTLAGRGDFAVVGALAALVGRGLLQVRTGGTDGSSAMLRRQQLLAALEGLSLPEAPALEGLSLPEAPALEGLSLPEAPALEGLSLPEAPAGLEEPAAATPLLLVPDQPASTEAADDQPLTVVPLADAPSPDGAGHDELSMEGRSPAIPGRPEPFLPVRRPDHADGGSAAWTPAGPGAPAVGAVHGSAALQPDPLAVPVERDPMINRTLVLRLIAGVRGL